MSKIKNSLFISSIIAAVFALSCLSPAWAQMSNKHADTGVACEQCHQGQPEGSPIPSERCQTCHGDYDKLAQTTQNIKPNPHFTHLGDVDCVECHRNHSESVLVCNDCHKFNLKTP